MNSEKQDIELRSEEFSEILGQISPWILRWGITMVAIVALVLLIGSAIFKYPDTINATVTMTGVTPVFGVIAKTSGRMQELFVVNNQRVEKDTYLAVIENSAKTNDVVKLKKMIQQIGNSLDTITLIPSQQLQLGNLQSLYSSFIRLCLNISNSKN